MPIVVIRYDNYRVDLERKTSHLGFWNIEVRFTGKPRWLVRLGAKQGRLVITFDDRKKRWYAHVNVEVTLEGKLNGLKAGVDLGREVLAAVATEPLSGNGEGAALLYRGAALKSDYFYCERRIARADRTLSDPKSEEMDRGVLHAERRRRIYQLFCNLATHLARA